ncbi:HAD-IA family hydrolase [Singulisphaera sp. PoT]|uniref:HAD-IA family hydrolase n=1 Tax=Singulisphaera sp. PoT TaxID=3411797 RepID=UPI003BF53695
MLSDQKTGTGFGGIVLDAVGTLIEAHPPVAEAYIAVARRQGVELETDLVRSRFREFFRKDDLANERGPLATDEATERRRWQAIVGGVLGDLPDFDRAFDELWSHFACPSSWRCFDDVGPILAELRSRGIPCWIASNFDSRLRDVVAGLEELRPMGEHLVISSEVGYKKPHPAFFDALVARCGVEAGRLLSVGDDLENDVLGAMRAGLRAVWIDRGNKADGQNPPRIFDLREVTRFLEG